MRRYDSKAWLFRYTAPCRKMLLSSVIVLLAIVIVILIYFNTVRKDIPYNYSFGCYKHHINRFVGCYGCEAITSK